MEFSISGQHQKLAEVLELIYLTHKHRCWSKSQSLSSLFLPIVHMTLDKLKDMIQDPRAILMQYAFLVMGITGLFSSLPFIYSFHLTS